MNQKNKQANWFLGMLLAALGASLLRNMLAGGDIKRAVEGTIRVGKGLIRAGQDI